MTTSIVAIIAVVAALIAVYAVWLRPWLRKKTWAQGFMLAIEPYEITLYRKSETILWARLKQLVGVLLTVLTSVGAIDMAALMPFIPDRYQWAPALLPLLITVVGAIDEKLRSDVSKPIEVTELPQAKTPEVAAAVAKADAANVAAVVAVEVAKAEERVSL